MSNKLPKVSNNTKVNIKKSNKINSTVLLHGTGNYIQYLVIAYNERECEKEIYISESYNLNHFPVHWNLNQHCKSTIPKELKN